MFSVYNGYKTINTDKKTYFAGANTGEGFVGVYSDIADERELKRVYIIKGGAGCGKSTLMRKTAEVAEREGYSVEYYLCGSDPSSLDCIVIDGKIAVLDGTSPHIKEMTFPGACSEIVDITKYWESVILEKRKEEIIENTLLKKADYESAYRYLRAAETIERERKETARSFFDKEKALKYIERFLKNIKASEVNSLKNKIRYSHSLSMTGAWKVDTDLKCSRNVYTVSETQGTASFFMDLLHSELTTRRIPHTLSLMPLGRNITAITLEKMSTTVIVSDDEKYDKKINMDRFVSKEEFTRKRGQIRLAGKCEQGCISDALGVLSSASIHHFELEEVYKSAMDFESLSDYTETLITEIIERIEKNI